MTTDHVHAAEVEPGHDVVVVLHLQALHARGTGRDAGRVHRQPRRLGRGGGVAGDEVVVGRRSRGIGPASGPHRSVPGIETT